MDNDADFIRSLSPECESLYHAALAADAAFSAELRKRFGYAAGDRRYDLTRRGWTRAIITAHDAWVEADNRWLTAYRAERRGADQGGDR